MPDWLQGVVIVVLSLILYFTYIHGFLRSLRVEKVTVDMSEKQVRKLLGRPKKIHNKGSEVVLSYKFEYANRLAPTTIIFVKVGIRNGKVSWIDKNARV